MCYFQILWCCCCVKFAILRTSQFTYHNLSNNNCDIYSNTCISYYLEFEVTMAGNVFDQTQRILEQKGHLPANKFTTAHNRMVILKMHFGFVCIGDTVQSRVQASSFKKKVQASFKCQIRTIFATVQAVLSHVW